MNVTDKLFAHLPPAVAFELERISLSRRGNKSAISEIRLRANGRSSAVICSQRIFLSHKLCEEEIRSCFLSLCEGSLYAYRDSISEGYITMPGAIRVGIAGKASYESGKLVGISDITSLVFRIPTLKSELCDELFSAWEKSTRGMLVFSSPGLGKTTALRTLVGMIASGKGGKQVAVIDSRSEFSSEDYKGASVDILSGYKRSHAIEIALRTLSPEIIVIDEIGGESEALSMLEYMNSGVKILASAHAGSITEARKRSALLPFFNADVFDVFFEISLVDGRRVAKTHLAEALAL